MVLIDDIVGSAKSVLEADIIRQWIFFGTSLLHVQKERLHVYCAVLIKWAARFAGDVGACIFWYCW